MLAQLGTSNVRAIGRIALLAALLIGACTVLFARAGGARAFTNIADFRAFYCAGAAIDAGRDPYRAEPLRSCEIAQTIAAGAEPAPNVAMPAPLPGYALAIFALAARLPFAAAALGYTGVLVASLAATAYLIGRLAPFPPFAIAGALALGDGWVSIGYGQIFPISLLLLCAAALLVARGRDGVAAACAAAATIEPHIALPACIALFALRPRARVPLAIGAALLAAVACASLGWRTNVEYVSEVLRAHALAEAADIRQFGLTALLWRAGVDPAPALALADLSYALMVVLGVAAAGRFAYRFGAPELVVLVPPAFAVAGGPFMHTVQLAAAVPALLVLAARVPRARAALSGALLILAIPWLELAENPLIPDLIAVAAASAAITIGILRAAPLRTTTIVLASAAAAACERCLRTRVPPLHVDVAAELARAAGGTLSAEVTWAIHTRGTAGTAWFVASHAPDWIGLIVMLAAMTAIAVRGSAGSRETRGFARAEAVGP